MIVEPVFGMMAEFDTPTDIVVAARRTSEAGYRKIDAYSPFPIEELGEVIGFHHNGVALVALVGGLCGCLGGFMLQYWVSTISYPINIGGRPMNSWPSFIPVTFEMTILFAGLSAVIGMLVLNGLPQPYHPVFNVPRFARASQDKFFLIIFSSDPRYDTIKTRAFLEGLGGKSISEVPS
jgi:hypothetical protein